MVEMNPTRVMQIVDMSEKGTLALYCRYAHDIRNEGDGHIVSIIQNRLHEQRVVADLFPFQLRGHCHNNANYTSTGYTY